MQKFIFQGFTADTHQSAIISLFDVPQIKNVIVSAAFVNKSGVELIQEKLRENSAKAQAFIGIRNDITSVQGAQALLDSGLNLYVVDTGARTIIFHPKLYLVRGSVKARLLIGSANLTAGGLNNNIEASMLMELDLTKPDEKTLVSKIESDFSSLPQDYPDHIFRIQDAQTLNELELAGRLTNELTSLPIRSVGSAASPVGDSLPRIRLRVTPIRGNSLGARRSAAIVSAPPTSTPTSAPLSAQGVMPQSINLAVGVDYELVWESPALTRRDLDVPDGNNTNRTGSINLDKGQLADGVDHRHYFRDEVFSQLSWSASSRPGVDEAHANFKLLIKGVSYGQFNLRIGHTTSTTSAAYLQRNAMTRLSWGPIREHVARLDLIGRTLSLYRDKAAPKEFVLEID